MKGQFGCARSLMLDANSSFPNEECLKVHVGNEVTSRWKMNVHTECPFSVCAVYEASLCQLEKVFFGIDGELLLLTVETEICPSASYTFLLSGNL